MLCVTTIRTADLLSTWLVSPDLRREINPLIRWLGWRWTILLNLVVVIPLALVQPLFFWPLVVFSLAATGWNVRLWLRSRVQRRIGCGPFTFERWLRSLLNDPKLLALEAKTPEEIQRYQMALRKWQERGCPYPGEFPTELKLSAFTRQWVEHWLTF